MSDIRYLRVAIRGMGGAGWHLSGRLKERRGELSYRRGLPRGATVAAPPL